VTSSGGASSNGSPRSTADVFARIDRRSAAALDQLRRYLRIPSVSTDPAYAADVLRCCDFVVDAMRGAGLEARRIDTAGHPLAYGEWCAAPGRPTVLFYGHYDVQPPEPLDAWRHPPFEAVVEGDHLIARGATDDKGQSLTHLMAVAAMLEERGELPVNVRFILEGEEESGGTALETFVREDGGRLLACDAVVVSDGTMAGPGRPSLLYGIRGIVCAEITVTGPDHDLHSGSYGGAVANPLEALCRIVTGLRDPATWRVTIPGFYDAVRPLDEEERRALAELPFDADAYAREAGVEELVGEEGFSTFERLWARPTLDVNGLRGGYQGPGSKTVLPSMASAKVSMRLVPDQDPDAVADGLRRHVGALTPPGVRVAVEHQLGAPALRIDLDHPVMAAAATALEEVWGTAPVRVRDGGSLPILTTFTEVLGVPVVLAGFGLPDDRPHAPNEKFDLRHFDLGTRTTARLLDLVACLDLDG